MLEKYSNIFKDYDKNRHYHINTYFDISGLNNATPIMYLLYNKNKLDKNIIFDYIKNNPNEINQTNGIGFSPLMFELDQQTRMSREYEFDVDLIECLLKNGADTNIITGYSVSALNLCFWNDGIPKKERSEIFKLLLDYGANVNISACNKQTLLHNAVRINNYENVKLLLEYGADINARDNDGSTPIMCLNYCHRNDEIGRIEYYKNKELITNLLLNYNSDIFIENKKGFNVLYENQYLKNIYQYSIDLERYKTYMKILKKKIINKSSMILFQPDSMRSHILSIKWHNYDYQWTCNNYPKIIDYFNIVDEQDLKFKINDALKYI
ncbi:ankyrin repeat protein [Megavirus baoshan]|uniref:Ankyrin repeat protein n=1 Tax=Megavirus baoshan TaxID=2496520 RepID=A0A3Q8U8S5_9VIRU|nr:ankyrin repeat protein [Megavirus baoshan]AZL89889.1 ankyrin repeat protein [Megavirus baoshan]